MKNIVTVGGGTGSYTVLSGLKNLKGLSLTALVSMADDGGSTGILRKKWGVMPPGDVRQCLAALSGKEFLNHRSRLFWGHKIGNVILAVLEKVSGDFSRGLKIASSVLGVEGRIIPITKDDASLEISFVDGSTVSGEGNIDQKTFPSAVKNLYYKNKTVINPEGAKALADADYIIIAPGNLFSSLLPSFIVDGFTQSIQESQAKIVLIMNLVNKQGHTIGWGKAEYLKTIEKYLGKSVDFILDNGEDFSKEQKEQYLKNSGDKIFIKDNLKDPRIIKAPILSKILRSQDNGDSVARSLIRHDSQKLAEAIEKIIQRKKYIFDFYDVIFYATRRRKEYIDPKLVRVGINSTDIDNYYEQNRHKAFSLRALLLHFSLGEEFYMEVMDEIKDFRNEQLIKIIESIGKDNCYMVTFGDKEFQLDKITRAEVAHLFSEIFIVSESKKRTIESICNKHKDETVIFIDDKAYNFEDLDFAKYPNLKTVLYDENGLEKLEEEIKR